MLHLTTANGVQPFDVHAIFAEAAAKFREDYADDPAVISILNNITVDIAKRAFMIDVDCVSPARAAESKAEDIAGWMRLSARLALARWTLRAAEDRRRK